MCSRELWWWWGFFPLLPFAFVIKSAEGGKKNYSRLNKYGSTTIPAVRHHVFTKNEKNEFLPDLYLNLHGTHFTKIAHMSLHLFFFLNQALNMHLDSHVGNLQHSKMTVYSIIG